jgi:hypothetical protein
LPAVAAARFDTVSVAVPGGVSGLGETAAVLPVGAPVTANAIGLVKPASAPTAIDTVALPTVAHTPIDPGVVVNENGAAPTPLMKSGAVPSGSR